MKLILAFTLLIALLAMLGMCTWGTATAATSLALAGGIAANQVTITVLALGMLILVGVMLFVGVKMFGLGRMVERRRADDEITEMTKVTSVRDALDRARTHASQSRTGVPIFLLAPPQQQIQTNAPRTAPRRLIRRAPSVRRAASRIAKRWFS